MSPIEQLRSEAKDKRDAAIAAAEEKYRATLADLNAVARHLGRSIERMKYPPRHSNHGGDFSKMTAVEAAEIILQEKGPLHIPELAIEAMNRGYRQFEEPRKVGHALRQAMYYQKRKGRFLRDGEGRWSSTARL